VLHAVCAYTLIDGADGVYVANYFYFLTSGMPVSSLLYLYLVLFEKRGTRENKEKEYLMSPRSPHTRRGRGEDHYSSLRASQQITRSIM
jgi:hypothetical protein